MRVSNLYLTSLLIISSQVRFTNLMRPVKEENYFAPFKDNSYYKVLTK
jgi:hypothetical protein